MHIDNFSDNRKKAAASLPFKQGNEFSITQIPCLHWLISEQIIGTLSQILSSVEFYPLYIRNPLYCLIHQHLLLWCPIQNKILSAQPLYEPIEQLLEPRANPGQTTHKKGCWLLVKPQAISRNPISSIFAMLPKHTYMTELGFGWFNQWIVVES